MLSFSANGIRESYFLLVNGITLDAYLAANGSAGFLYSSYRFQLLLAYFLVTSSGPSVFARCSKFRCFV